MNRKVRLNNCIAIMYWMRLACRNIDECMAYAFIFSQYDKRLRGEDMEYLQEWLLKAPKSKVLSILQKLEKKGLIQKETIVGFGVEQIVYKAVDPNSAQFNQVN